MARRTAGNRLETETNVNGQAGLTSTGRRAAGLPFGRLFRPGALRAALVTCLSSSMVAGAAAPIPNTTPPACVSPAGNARLSARVTPASANAPVASVRVYFHAGGEAPADYFLEMRPGSGDLFWAVLPRIRETTSGVVYRVLARDAAGQEAATHSLTVPAGSGCPTPNLDPDEKKYAANLVLGLTADAQSTPPPGFLCDGIISVIRPNGQLVQANCASRGMPPIAWIGLGVGAAVAGGGIIISNKSGGGGGGPVSSARPVTGSAAPH